MTRSAPLSVSLSSFVRVPERTLDQLDEAGAVLTRKRGRNLRLAWVEADRVTEPPPAPAAEQAAPRQPGSPLIRDLAEAALAQLPADRLSSLLGQACPWAADLPPAARRQFDTQALAARDAGPAELAATLGRWQQTAAAFARG